MHKFAERLKDLRISKKLSQSQLSINLNYKVSQAAIAYYENGQRIPSLDVAILFANYFKVSLNYIAGLED